MGENCYSTTKIDLSAGRAAIALLSRIEDLQIQCALHRTISALLAFDFGWLCCVLPRVNDARQTGNKAILSISCYSMRRSSDIHI